MAHPVDGHNALCVCHNLYRQFNNFSLYTVVGCNIQPGNSPLEFEKEAESLHQDKKEGPDLLDKDDDASDHISDRQHDFVDDHPGKSRWSFQSLITPQLKSYLYLLLLLYEILLKKRSCAGAGA